MSFPLHDRILLPSFGPIDAKWLLKAFDTSDDLNSETPSTLTSLMDNLSVLRQVSSLIACHVFRGFPLDSTNLLV